MVAISAQPGLADPSRAGALHLANRAPRGCPNAVRRWALPLAYNLSTRGGGTVSSSCSPGSSCSSHALLIWGPPSENPATRARRGWKKEGLGPCKKTERQADFWPLTLIWEVSGAISTARQWRGEGRTLRKEMPLASTFPVPESGPGWPMVESGEDTGPTGQQLVISVGHTGCASQLRSRTGPGHGRTA